MAVVEINSGICGFVTRVEVKKTDHKTVEVDIDTDCPNLKRVAASIKQIKPAREMFCKLHDTDTYRALLKGLAHPACPVPVGILKGIEAEAGLALPKDAYIKVSA